MIEHLSPPAAAVRRRSGGLLAVVGALTIAVAGCGQSAETSATLGPTPGAGASESAAAPAGSPTASASPSAATSPSPSPSAATSPSASASSSPSGSATPTPAATPSGPVLVMHVDQALEDKLPSQLGDIPLAKLSMELDLYLRSATSGDKTVYQAWLSDLGLDTAKATYAVAADVNDEPKVTVIGIRTPGADSAKLVSTFKTAADAAGWPTRSESVANKPLLAVIDPNAAAGRNTAHVFAKQDVTYFVVTDDPALLLQAVAELS